MKNNELKRLRRGELLELLVEQGRQMEQLEQELEQAKAELARRDIAIQESGSMAEAALKLNGVFEAADAAARQYLEILQRRARREDFEKHEGTDAPEGTGGAEGSGGPGAENA